MILLSSADFFKITDVLLVLSICFLTEVQMDGLDGWTMQKTTVNSENFARFLFLQNYAKFRENKILTKGRNDFVIY